jgi:hypothetical protein
VLGTTKTQYEGYGLIAFFMSIVVTSLVVDFASQGITTLVIALSSNWSLAAVVAIMLGLLVYGDMRLRYYSGSETKR